MQVYRSASKHNIVPFGEKEIFKADGNYSDEIQLNDVVKFRVGTILFIGQYLNTLADDDTENIGTEIGEYADGNYQLLEVTTTVI